VFRRPSLFFVLVALLASLFAAGCGREVATLSAEGDDSTYREAQQLEREGRTDEALALYLKVIARRGDAAPESHLDAGIISLNHNHDPIYAIYYFRKYLELEPNSKHAPLVRGMIDAAKREFARTLPGGILNDQNDRPVIGDQLEKLHREDDEYKAEVSALHAAGPVVPLMHAAPEGTEPGAVGAAPPGSTIVLAPFGVSDSSSVVREVPADSSQPAPVAEVTPRAALPAASAPPPHPSPSQAGVRHHAVVPGDSLYGLAVHYYGNRSRWHAIYEANRDLLPDPSTKLRVGMELKIP